MGTTEIIKSPVLCIILNMPKLKKNLKTKKYVENIIYIGSTAFLMGCD